MFGGYWGAFRPGCKSAVLSGKVMGGLLKVEFAGHGLLTSKGGVPVFPQGIAGQGPETK